MILVKITKEGNLQILRGKKLKTQYCPHAIDFDNASECGDWCPYFKEPINYSTEEILLKLCNGTEWKIPKENFKDERELKEDGK